MTIELVPLCSATIELAEPFFVTATPMGTPLSNLHVDLLNRAGVSVPDFGDSTARLDLNSPPPAPTNTSA